VSGPGGALPEEDLHAYVDNQLDPDRRAEVARRLAEDPVVSERVAAYRKQREELRAALADLPFAGVPPHLDLQGLIAARLAQRRTVWRSAAAVVLAFGVGGTGGWFLHREVAPAPSTVTVLVREALANHVVYTADRRRPTELGAEQRDDLARWVSNRLNRQVAPPDLSDAGFRYIGGRLAATPEGPAGMFMYQNEKSVRLTVFVRPIAGVRNVPISRVGDASLGGCAWIDKGVGYTVVAPVPEEELERIAHQVRRSLDAAT
jgi:anti-sigma factor RsiW